jgi:DNA polymerase-3 subunit gamma/tau
MAYQALARKWRPRNFSQVVGQEHVIKALTHALQFDRLHHAYLFTGTRGVGKTTLARILAKAMNCENRTGFDPCGECLFCREVDEGRFVDLIEVDAASRTKVEDTRDLLENVQYAPNQGRFKVYLIDEVHMLSGHSFNALLKTLEEPPPHVKFLLATTDPQKIPVTVLSRCLQFNLKRLSPEQIRGQMEAILTQENIAFEPNTLRALSRAADGSMRDGLSLLDQAIVHGGGRLEDAPVSAMLGTVSRKPVFQLLDALVQTDAVALLDTIAELASHAPNFADVLQQLLIVLHHAALAQWVPDAIRHDDDAERIFELAKRLRPEDLQLFYQIGLLGQRDLPLAPEPRGGFEMVLLRMLAFRPASHEMASVPSAAPPKTPQPQQPAPRQPVHLTGVPSRPLPAASVHAQEYPPVATTETLHRQVPAPVAVDNVPPWEDEPSPIGEARTIPAAPQLNTNWADILRQLRLGGLTLQLASHCNLRELDEHHIVLALDPKAAAIHVPSMDATLEKALQAYFKRPLKLSIVQAKPTQETPAQQTQRQQQERQHAAEQEIEQDPVVLALKERFDARIVPGSIKPLD